MQLPTWQNLSTERKVISQGHGVQKCIYSSKLLGQLSFCDEHILLECLNAAEASLSNAAACSAVGQSHAFAIG